MYCVTRSCLLYRLPPEGFDFGWYQLHLPWKTTYLNYGVLENKDRKYSPRSLATWECLGRSMGIWVFMVPREFCRAGGWRRRHSGQTAPLQLRGSGQARAHIIYFEIRNVNSPTLLESYGFSSSQVWMWELDHKEGWASKNWCFWTTVLVMNGVQSYICG